MQEVCAEDFSRAPHLLSSDDDLVSLTNIMVVLTWTGVSGLGGEALVSPELLWLQVLMYIMGLSCNNSMGPLVP